MIKASVVVSVFIGRPFGMWGVAGRSGGWGEELGALEAQVGKRWGSAHDQKAGNPTLVKYQSEAVSQSPVRPATRRPPATGSAAPGRPRTRSSSSFVARAP